jgi:hypothetical protein
MSDTEEKKSGYRLEYAKNNRAKCKGRFLLLNIVSLLLYLAHCSTRFMTQQAPNLAMVGVYFAPDTLLINLCSSRNGPRKGHAQTWLCCRF